ncbi:hypothetical protein CesoFtcFv8_005655 [Champsocephalus esox]|uniref:Uncharacterized protein n=1 Tax=Champsocephalus esox TaxID=159716 RepID=A0AAN8CQ16_9TELE|nr:hypothetical protein CesoFtcFv8_005655 [Champsocephalus esox]
MTQRAAACWSSVGDEECCENGSDPARNSEEEMTARRSSLSPGNNTVSSRSTEATGVRTSRQQERGRTG